MLKIVFGLVRAGCQRLFMRGFQFRSILYSERCAQICLAPSQNLNVCRPKISVLFSLNLFSRYVSTIGSRRRVSQLAGVRGCRRKRLLSFLYNVFFTDVAKTSIINFGRVGTAFSGELHQPGPFCSSAASLARFFHVEFEIF